MCPCNQAGLKHVPEFCVHYETEETRPSFRTGPKVLEGCKREVSVTSVERTLQTNLWHSF